VGVAYAIQSPSVGQVTITSTATLIETPTVTNPFTYSMTLINAGSNTVYIGYTSSVTTATANIIIPPNGYVTMDKSKPAHWYGICSSGQTSIIAWTEEVL